MKKNVICNVTFGRYYAHKGVPCIEVNFTYNDEVLGTETFFLSAFRGYCFQVSFTTNGSGCMGDTPVFGLETLLSIEQIGRSNLGQSETQRYFATSIAMEAVYNAAQYPAHSDYNIGYNFPRTYDLSFNDYDDRYTEFRKFIDNTFKFIKGEEIEKVPYGWDHVEVYN